MKYKRLWRNFLNVPQNEQTYILQCLLEITLTSVPLEFVKMTFWEHSIDAMQKPGWNANDLSLLVCLKSRSNVWKYSLNIASLLIPNLIIPNRNPTHLLTYIKSQFLSNFFYSLKFFVFKEYLTAMGYHLHVSRQAECLNQGKDAIPRQYVK